MASEGHYLKMLRRLDLAADLLGQILGDRDARKFHTVRRALVGHPRTPRHEALSLVGTLYWTDLVHLSANARVHPEIRRAADRDLIRRVPDMALAERIALARSGGRGIVLVLRFDPDRRVLAGVLDNRFTIEADVVGVAVSDRTPAEALETIAAHPRWGVRRALRSALLRNPRLPTAVALSLLTAATAEDLAGIRQSPHVSRIIKACAERVLAHRGRPV
jgi:hypothetical protein